MLSDFVYITKHSESFRCSFLVRDCEKMFVFIIWLEHEIFKYNWSLPNSLRLLKSWI